MNDNATWAAGSPEPACWPLPPEWATFIPPQAVNIKHETISPENGGGTLTRPVWNEQWLRGLEAYVRGIVRDELSKANARLDRQEEAKHDA
jgi:hypothetical protein